MRKYMLVIYVDGQTSARFFDHYNEASEFAFNVECGCGGYAELYERKHLKHGDEYKFVTNF